MQRAKANADEARAVLAAATARGLSVTDLAKLRDSVTRAEALHARLCNSRVSTPQQIIRSEGWAELMKLFQDALRPYPDAARALFKAVQL